MSIVPFNKPSIPQLSREYLAESLSSGHMSGDGPMSRAAAIALSQITSGGTHLLTPSCTHSLELACRLLDLGPGDEVIMPSFNFPSAATAVALTGATPVFVDVDAITKTQTMEGTLAAATARTRAFIVLHYAGQSAPATEIRAFADTIGAHVIEDAAHALGVTTSQGTLGSIGTFGAYSFHETKNVHCGEGGSLQINDPAFVERAEILREKGTNRQRFFRGQVDKYSWVDHGSSWLLADPLSALLRGQLEEFDGIQSVRRKAFKLYENELAEWCSTSGFESATAPIGQDNAAHMFYLVAPNLETRQAFISHLRGLGVSAAFHYQPLHLSPAGLRLGRADNCTVSVELGDRLVRLPLFTTITETEVERVISAVRSFRNM